MLKEDFVLRAISVHGNKYDYSKVEYTNNKIPVEIVCEKHGSFKQRPDSHLNGRGCYLCGCEKKRSLILGFGVYDMHNEKNSNAFKAWLAMLKRCYSKFRGNVHAWDGCSVSEEWRYFSNFKEWFDARYKDGFELDKDLKVRGNKVYSPNTCLLVPPRINELTTNVKKYGKYKNSIGVKKSSKNTFTAWVCKMDKRVYLGSFKTEEDAFNAYKNTKIQYIKDVANEYLNKGIIGNEIYETLLNYKIE